MFAGRQIYYVDAYIFIIIKYFYVNKNKIYKNTTINVIKKHNFDNNTNDTLIILIVCVHFE